jgi:hypothetical protein
MIHIPVPTKINSNTQIQGWLRRAPAGLAGGAVNGAGCSRCGVKSAIFYSIQYGFTGHQPSVAFKIGKFGTTSTCVEVSLAPLTLWAGRRRPASFQAVFASLTQKYFIIIHPTQADIMPI